MTLNPETPLLSVVIPTYNRKDYLPQALKSVLDQSPREIEVIVVDDGSTDGTDQAIQNFGDDRVKYVYQKNRGEGGARNRGLDLSRGKYIAFLDSDDVWWPSRVSTHLQTLETNPTVDLVYGPHFEGDDKLQPQMMTVPQTELRFEDWLEGCQFGSLSATFRSDCLNSKIRANEEMILAPDWDFWLRLFAKGCQALYHPAPTGIVRNHTHSQTVNITGLSEAYRTLVETWTTEHDVTFAPDFQTNRHYSNAVFAIRRGQTEIAVSEIRQAISSNNISLETKKLRVVKNIVGILADPFCTNPDEFLKSVIAAITEIIGELPISLQYLQAEAYLIRARDALMTDRFAAGKQALAQASSLEPAIIDDHLSLFVEAAIRIAGYRGTEVGEQLLEQTYEAWPANRFRNQKRYRRSLGLYYFNLGLLSHQHEDFIAANKYMLKALKHNPILISNRGLLSILLGRARPKPNSQNRDGVEK